MFADITIADVCHGHTQVATPICYAMLPPLPPLLLPCRLAIDYDFAFGAVMLRQRLRRQ